MSSSINSFFEIAVTIKDINLGGQKVLLRPATTYVMGKFLEVNIILGLSSAIESTTTTLTKVSRSTITTAVTVITITTTTTSTTTNIISTTKTKTTTEISPLKDDNYWFKNTNTLKLLRKDSLLL